MTRIDRVTYYLRIAETVALRSTCLRLQVGAILVRDGRILSTGYNGAPRDFPHCTPETCHPGIEHCLATVHAELNAILCAAYNGVSTRGATLYCTHAPCQACARAIVNAGIVAVFFRHWGTARGFLLLNKVGISTDILSEPGDGMDD